MEELNIAIQKFEELKNNAIFFSDQECLKMASAIRKNILADERIASTCSEDSKYLTVRREILEQIQQFQSDIISTATLCHFEFGEKDNVEFNNPASAKKDLYKIISEEVEKNISPRYPIASELPEMKSHVKTLESMADRGFDRTYRVLTIGEYQTGKTTFLDSITGMHIGAIGSGNTTSAVPLTISYGNVFGAEIVWKTDESIKSTISVLEKIFEGFEIDTFDLSDAISRAKLLERLDEFRRNKDCPAVKQPGCKSLAICSILLKYYATQELIDFKSQKISITEISDLSRFPEALESRWHKKGSSTFSFKESIFPFIERINTFIPSQRLKQLGCTLIDSPGLFSNDYDSQITEREMLAADAIIYLLPYDREMGLDTAESLYLIRKKYEFAHRKLFIVNNWDNSGHKKFFTSNNDAIRGMFGSSVELHRVDARLAFLGEIKRSYDEHLLSEEDQNSFIKKAEYDFGEEESVKFDSFSSAWEEYVDLYRRKYRWDQIPSADEVTSSSGILDVLSKLRQFIEKNEAYSVIYEGGIARLSNELLSTIKATKVRYVEPYFKGKVDLGKLWTGRISRSSDFYSHTAPNIIQKHLFDSLDETPALSKRLTEIIFSQIFNEESYKSLVRSICVAIYNKKWELVKCGKDEIKVKEIVTPSITKAISSYITDQLSQWNALIKSDQDPTFTSTFHAQFLLMRNELQVAWNKTFADDEEFKNQMDRYFITPRDTKLFAINTNAINGISHKTTRDDVSVSVSLLGSILAEISEVVAIIITLALPTVLALVSNPIGWAIGGVAAIGATLYWGFSGDDIMENAFIRTNAPKIKEKMDEENILHKLNGIVEMGVHQMLQDYSENLVRLEMGIMQDDRDVSLSTPLDVVEANCFQATELISKINEQLAVYSDFITQHILCPKSK